MKPILFNTEMVRAIQNGTKTITRRVVKPKYTNTEIILKDGKAFETAGTLATTVEIKPLYNVGDILYVRETWTKMCCCDCEFEGEECEYNIDRGGLTITCDDGVYVYKATDLVNTNIKWRPSIHMPKEAARIFLRVTDVRVERLQDIKIRDIVAEGIYEDCQDCFENYGYGNQCCIGENDECHLYDDAVTQFENVWNSTIKKSELGKYGWNANPGVRVIEFERISKEEATK